MAADTMPWVQHVKRFSGRGVIAGPCHVHVASLHLEPRKFAKDYGMVEVWLERRGNQAVLWVTLSIAPDMRTLYYFDEAPRYHLAAGERFVIRLRQNRKMRLVGSISYCAKASRAAAIRSSQRLTIP